MEIHLIIGAICGIIAAAIASSKGRSVVGWFFGGLLIGLIGVIIVAVLPNKKHEKAQRERTEFEQHRLREQLRQERLKNEAFRRYAVDRLDCHDASLGTDTRSRLSLPGDPSAAAALPDGGPPMPGVFPPAGGAAWYYEEAGQTRGPVSEQAIRTMLMTRQIGANTLLWSDGMSQWTLARDIPAFRFEAST